MEALDDTRFSILHIRGNAVLWLFPSSELECIIDVHALCNGD